jgi:prevent-host-death family protein
MDTIPAGRAAKNLGEHLDRVRRGEALAITNNGRPIAVLRPWAASDATDETDETRTASLAVRFAAMAEFASTDRDGGSCCPSCGLRADRADIQDHARGCLWTVAIGAAAQRGAA